MKRFSLIVSLAACLILLLGTVAFGSWGFDIPSKTLSQNAVGVTADITAYWDIKTAQFTLPMVVRSVSGGAYWTGALPVDTSGGPVVGVTWNWSNPGWASIVQTIRPGLSCNDPDAYDGVSPDNMVLAAQGAGTDTPAEPSGRVICTLTFDVNGNVGDFEIDTACFTTQLNTIFMVDNVSYVDHGPTGNGDATWSKGVFTIEPNQCPTDPGAYASGLVSGSEQQGLSNAWDGSSYSDPEGDAAAFVQTSGPGTTDPVSGLWSWTPGCGDDGDYLVEIDVADVNHGAGVCGFVLSFNVHVDAIPVGLTCIPDATIHFGDVYTGTATASSTCTPVTFSGDVASDGSFSFASTCGDLGDNVFDVTATDVASRSESCQFTVTVTNQDPVCAIPDDHFLFTDGYSYDLAGGTSDPDGDGLTYSNLTITPTPPDNMPALAGSMVTWDPTDNDAQFNGGLYTLTVDIFDGCATVTCTWDLTVQYTQPYKISVLDPDASFGTEIPLEAHYLDVLNGRNATVGLHMKNGFIQGSCAFDFLLCYDCSALSFLSAEKGPAIADWEYFTYRYGPFGNNCGSGCPSCYIRVIGIRDMNNGSTPAAGSEFVNGYIAYLTFRVSDDRSLLNMCARIGFCSIDCGDNIISDITGDEVALAFPDQNDPEGYFITFGPNYSLDTCLLGDKSDTPPVSFAYFDPGYICIVPPPDDRGDINLNGIANEVADAVLYTNYFIYGPSVWDDTYYENQILASDINDDGIVLTVADLVYLIRIITGDAQPFPASGEGAKLSPYASSMDVNTEMVDGNMIVTTNSTSDLGAGHLVFRYTGLTVGTPSTSTAMDVKSNAANGELRVLVYSMQNNSVEAGVTQLVTIPVEGNGTLELVESSFSDAEGSLLTVDMHRLAPPTAYELMQNYPNPFNASTMIRFAMKDAGDWTLKIYNVAGQVVDSFEGTSEPGTVTVNWNAEVASGIYFYKVAANDFTATKKMVLMK